MKVLAPTDSSERALLLRFQGLVQGVGMRPMIWRLAQGLGLRGTVANDGQGVLVHVCGPGDALARFVNDVRQAAPPLARIERIDQQDAPLLPADAGFTILASRHGGIDTAVAPDAASCAACVAEVFDPSARRYRYPFTNCTHCGPRLSIVQGIPYDRASTTMQAFALCTSCRAEYENPADRRFHAQPMACAHCGPRAWITTAGGKQLTPVALGAQDALEAAGNLLQRGAIVAIKGLGGFQLACSASDAAAVDRLRARKHREYKPFALMVRDMAQLRRHCRVDADEEELLRSTAAPIVLLARRPDTSSDAPALAAGIAPGLATLACMLPNTAMHHLLMRHTADPIVLTSGNLAGEPQLTDNQQALEQLGSIADYFLLHDRDVARRLDDSVLRMMDGKAQVLRRARGLAPSPIQLPAGFAAAPPVLALGGELKNSLCLLHGDKALVSHHIGDLEDARTYADFQKAIHDYLQLFEHHPQALAADLHPDYLSAKFAQAWVDRAAGDSGDARMELIEVGHHHAHIAACLADNGVPLHTAAVVGIAMDGLGYGENGELWGGEFLLADYRQCRRLATLRPVALLGGAQAMREPWRNTYSHLMACIGWPELAQQYATLDLVRRLDEKPRALLDGMLRGGVNSPLASSCGRLFDAVAAACAVCFSRNAYEGQAAMEFEALADTDTLALEDDALAYPFGVGRLPHGVLPCIDPAPMWRALLDELQRGTPTPLISARFHQGLAIAISRMAHGLADAAATGTVALSGGVFQNRILLEEVTRRLRQSGLEVLTHRQVPANDGGLALGQAVVAAARLLAPAATPASGV